MPAAARTIAQARAADNQASHAPLFYIEAAYESLNKQGEELCGDQVEIVRTDDYVLAVLSDGLGSGVKANILATLTGKIAATMLKAGASLEDVVETVASTLPVCSVRQIAYSTFSILQVFRDGHGYVVEFDNPPGVYLQKARPIDMPGTERVIDGKVIRECRFRMKAGDAVMLYSDGVLHAGVGKLLNLGWQRSEIKTYLARSARPDMTATHLARILLSAVDTLYQSQPGDDATVLVLRCRPDEPATVMVGPPVDPGRDIWAVGELMGTKGLRAVCGGTTSQIVARVAGLDLKVSIDYPDPTVPPTGTMAGIDLVTEGIITLTRTLELMREYNSSSNMQNILSLTKADGASRLANLLLEQATDVRFIVGRALNPAHQNPDLSLDLALKLHVVDEIAKLLRSRGRQVRIDYA